MASLINIYHCCVFTEHNHSEFSFIFRHIFEKTKEGSLLKAGFTCGLDRVTLRVLSQLTPSEDYLGLLTPVRFSVLIKMAVSH